MRCSENIHQEREYPEHFNTIHIGRFIIPSSILAQKAYDFRSSEKVFSTYWDIQTIFSSLVDKGYWSNDEKSKIEKLFLQVENSEETYRYSFLHEDKNNPTRGFGCPEEGAKEVDFELLCGMHKTSDFRILLKFIAIAPEKNLKIIAEYEDVILCSDFSNLLCEMAKDFNRDYSVNSKQMAYSYEISEKDEFMAINAAMSTAAAIIKIHRNNREHDEKTWKHPNGLFDLDID